ncbi:hypothetical protein [Marinobacterium sediminicola]|uniref:Tetratricopeptide repeat n=1 Tax=Marinobacterium sediminicola TaxID=518898 RepID=A0ABY1RXT0_9GAMM|nr:hypothetical protein [Marinobacterium sediminicola]ULG68594.1 hypothetical protein LN244_12940 [Marinobacterium sediminicola]SMR73112.1 Tetratricopeptide repeat [Marinobacterium sediminicola]
MDTLFATKRALVVDKQLDDLKSLRMLLLSLGLEQVFVASSVNMALSILREEPVDFCFMVHDLGKNEKSGLQLLHEAQAEGIYRQSTAYVLVADPETSALMFGSLESSPDLCIEKPYQTAQLRLSLERLMRMKQSLQPLHACMDEGRWSEALTLCEQTQMRFPALKVLSQRMRGIILLRLERYPDAYQQFEALLGQRDQHWMRVGAGVAAYRMGDLVQAEAALDQVIRQRQVCIDAFDWLARLHRLKGELQQSVNLLRKSVLLQPTVALLQARQGDTAARLKDWRLAVDSFRAAVQFGRYSAYQQPDYYFALAQSLRMRLEELQGDQAAAAEAEAVQVLERSVVDFDHDPVAQFRSRLLLSDLHRQGGESGRAEQSCRAALELFSGLPLELQAQWLDLLVDGLEHSSVSSQAQKVRQELTPKMLSIDWARANLKGMMHFRKAELLLARDEFVMAHQALPHNPSVSLNLLQAEMELLKRQHDKDSSAMIRRCDDLLNGLHFAALTPRQQHRYQALAERLAGLVLTTGSQPSTGSE